MLEPVFQNNIDEQQTPSQLVPQNRTLAPVAKSQKKVDQEIPMLLANATVLVGHDELRLAQDLIREALRIDSHHTEAIRMLGMTFAKENKWAEAKVCFEQLVNIDPDDRALSLLGEACYQLGEDQKALDLFLDAMLATNYEKSSLFDIFKTIGNIHVRSGDFDSAEEFYNKAFTLSPESDVLLVNYGTLEIQKEDLSRALNRFRQALEKNDKNDKAWVGLALVHHKHGDLDLSWANIEKALDSNPTNKTALQLMAQWSVASGKIPTTLEALDRFSENIGFDFDISVIRASLLILDQKWMEARVECELMLLWDAQCEVAEKLLTEIKTHA